MGTVGPALAPFWFTAEPRITAQMRSPSASASASRFRTTIPQPSLLTKPFADASKVLHALSGDSIPNSAISRVNPGDSTALTPPTRARSTSPCRNPATAWCAATSDAAQLSITGIVGPWRPSLKATRPTAMLPAVPR